MFFPKVGISPLKLPEYGVSFRFDPITAFPGEDQYLFINTCDLFYVYLQCIYESICSILYSEQSTSIEDVTKFVEALRQRLVSWITFTIYI